jgi:hypothetical protein
MTMKVSRISLIFSAVVSALVLISCPAPISVDPASAELSGLSITIGDQINARTLAPPLDMIPSLFTVSGSGPGASSFSVTTSGGTVSQTKLAVGVWTVTVQAANAGGIVIGSGEGVATVVNGLKTPVTIVVSTITGTGILSLATSWPVGTVPGASILGTLTPATGTGGTQEIPFVIAGNGASYSNQTIANGYYTLTFVVSSNGTVVAGAADIVRIVTGQTTAGAYIFSNVNTPGGVLTITVTQNFLNPLDVLIPGAVAYQAVGTTQVLTASIADAVPNVSTGLSYHWYVNGVSKGTGSTFTFGSGVLPGFYRIDLTAFTATGTRSGSATATIQVVTSIPTVLSVTPAGLSTGIPLNTSVSATFSEAMDASSLTAMSFTLKQGGNPVAGSLDVTGNPIIVFRPTVALAPTTVFTATLTTAVKASTGVPLTANKTWSFTTLNPAMVQLGAAGPFTILTRTGLSIGAAGKVSGDVGLSAAGTAGFTGFAMTPDSTNAYSTSLLLTGKAFDTDRTGSTPALLTSAAAAADAAIADALARGPPDNTNVGAGELGGVNFVPGLYKWTTAASITTDMSVQGGPNDVWIFQVTGALGQAAATTIHLTGGASAANIFWQVSGATTIGAAATFVGNVLSAGAILVGAGAVVTGHLYSQSSVGIGASALVSPSGT